MGSDDHFFLTWVWHLHTRSVNIFIGVNGSETRSFFFGIGLTLPHHGCDLFHRCDRLWNEKSASSWTGSDAFTPGCEDFHRCERFCIEKSAFLGLGLTVSHRRCEISTDMKFFTVVNDSCLRSMYFREFFYRIIFPYVISSWMRQDGRCMLNGFFFVLLLFSLLFPTIWFNLVFVYFLGANLDTCAFT